MDISTTLILALWFSVRRSLSVRLQCKRPQLFITVHEADHFKKNSAAQKLFLGQVKKKTRYTENTEACKPHILTLEGEKATSRDVRDIQNDFKRER